MVISIDLNEMSVLNYAVDNLKVDHVVVWPLFLRWCQGSNGCCRPWDSQSWLRISGMYIDFTELNSMVLKMKQKDTD